MDRQKIAWWLWAAGTAIIVLSWVNVVSPLIGWGGFAIALTGSILSWGLRPPKTKSSNDNQPDRREL
jgi:hypothetical protein